MRPSIDETMMSTAVLLARRSTCSRKHVGAVIADKQGHIASSGYNGTVRGADHCNHGDSDEPCSRAVHAEVNALYDAARRGVSLDELILWTTMSPCMACAMGIIQAGISEVRYLEPYRDSAGLELLRESGVMVIRYDPPES